MRLTLSFVSYALLVTLLLSVQYTLATVHLTPCYPSLPAYVNTTFDTLDYYGSNCMDNVTNTNTATSLVDQLILAPNITTSSNLTILNSTIYFNRNNHLFVLTNQNGQPQSQLPYNTNQLYAVAVAGNSSVAQLPPYNGTILPTQQLWSSSATLYTNSTSTSTLALSLLVFESEIDSLLSAAFTHNAQLLAGYAHFVHSPTSQSHQLQPYVLSLLLTDSIESITSAFADITQRYSQFDTSTLARSAAYSGANNASQLYAFDALAAADVSIFNQQIGIHSLFAYEGVDSNNVNDTLIPSLNTTLLPLHLQFTRAANFSSNSLLSDSLITANLVGNATDCMMWGAIPVADSEVDATMYTLLSLGADVHAITATDTNVTLLHYHTYSPLDHNAETLAGILSQFNLFEVLPLTPNQVGPSSYPHVNSALAAFTRLFFLASNALFLLPAAYAIKQFYYGKNTTSLLHIIACIYLCFASLTYHLCDNEDSPGDNNLWRVCFTSYDALHYNDFNLSLLVPVLIFTYNLDRRIIYLREIALLLTFICFGYAYHQAESISNAALFTIGVVICVLIVAVRGLARWHYNRRCYGLVPYTEVSLHKLHVFGYRWHLPWKRRVHSKREAPDTRIIWWFPGRDSDTMWGYACILCFVSAIVCYAIDTQYYYWWIHSVWHILAGIGLYLGFKYFDSFTPWPVDRQYVDVHTGEVDTEAASGKLLSHSPTMVDGIGAGKAADDDETLHHIDVVPTTQPSTLIRRRSSVQHAEDVSNDATVAHHSSADAASADVTSRHYLMPHSTTAPEASATSGIQSMPVDDSDDTRTPSPEADLLSPDVTSSHVNYRPLV